MKNIKQQLIDKNQNIIEKKEQEIKESDEELEMLEAEMKVENRAFEMEDITEELKEYFKYSIQSLENIIGMEENKNSELKKDLEILKYRKAVIKSQFTENELDY
jgi:hypothetical protein